MQSLEWLLVLATTSLSAAVYIPPGPLYTCPQKPLLLYPCRCLSGGDAGLILRCENSNLASIAVGLANMGAIATPVEELTLYRCSISKLYGPLLYPLKVRLLRIVETPLTKIEPHSFLGINITLQQLSIVQSKLEVFPTEAFQILGNLSVLEIDGHAMQSLPNDAFSGGLLSQKLEKLHISNGPLASIPAGAIGQLRKLKLLDLHGNAITELKKNQFKGLRDTEVLDLSFNSLSKIEGSHFADLTKMSWCNLSHNAIGDLTRGTFARNTVLRVLNLSHNKLRKLDSNSFRGLRFLRRVYFSDNMISDVGRGTFGTVTRIGTIDLARNNITKLDYQMFHQLQYVEIIDISENQVKEIHKLAFKDLYLVKINISHNVISKIEAGAFENCANITLLDLSHNNIEEIPRTAFDSTTYATEFLLSYNKFTDLSQVPLQNMTGLKILNVSHNEITTVPRNTFPKLYELHTVDLSNNKINNIWNAVFQTLFSLRSLNLSYNSLENIKGSTFGALHTLIEMDLSNNLISDINKGSLARLASLRTLKLRNNSISQIFQLPISLSHLDLAHNNIANIKTLQTWPSMNSLLSLDLSYNALQDSLEKGAFANLLTLQTLNIEGNGVTRPPWESLSDLTTLQYLYLQHNDIEYLPRGAFGRLPIVFELNLAHNKLNNISSRTFEGLLQLLTLNLTSNNLTTIPNGAFQGLVSLRTLDLSYNNLEKLDNKTHGLLDDCLSLERINLSHNKISFITRTTFPSNPWVPYRLREVDLSYNSMPVLTYDMTVGTRKLEVLNVSHNLLNEIRKSVLGNLTSLKVLDLSYNDLSDFPPKIFGPPPNLTSLYMAHNHFTKLPLEELLSLFPNIRLMDVRYNRLEEFHHQLMRYVENGTKILYEGNPVVCNCLIRPLRSWLATQTKPAPYWTDLRCAKPEFLAGQQLAAVTEDKMTCPDQREVADYNLKFDISPDLKFRDVSRNEEGHISVTWYVATREDVGSFYVVVRDIGNSQKTSQQNSVPIYEYEASYISRGHTIKKLPQTNGKVQVCVLARDSEGNVRRWHGSQCRLLSSEELRSSAAVSLPHSSNGKFIFAATLLLHAIMEASF